MRILLFVTVLLLGRFGYAQTVAPDTFALALKKVQKPQLIDVRTPAEFGDGHLPNATNINSQGADFTQSLSKLDKNQPVYVYCMSGGRSKGAVEKLHELGYDQVYELKGGYLKWASRMMPVEGVNRSTDKAQWSTARFDSLIQAQPLVLVDVYARWCAPCKKMMPLVDKLGEEMTGKLAVVKFNADTEKAMLAAYKVEDLPTLLVFRNGKLEKREIGFHDEAALRALLTSGN
ncbi:thioredoxin domain-containing protein [Spirosoma sp. KUDC1026]|uniref:thioredoxin domain-containing protein n=1 Tax=Spirosoma sp. KUDC1026 TaxID=2745947 RepID=UPI00159B960C|nr:thioredoxin domain-containing protein [Spirosoma sp. KUDC1026]QKZ14872.1 thioredoxin 1 [Spirosoma sp. KUDC1026]